MAAVFDIAVAPHLLRLEVDNGGGNPITVVNPTILTMMQEGPLKNLWRISGLAQSAARARCLTSNNVKVTALPRPPSVVVPTIDISVDGFGRPQLVVDFPGLAAAEALIDLEFRHSFNR